MDTGERPTDYYKVYEEYAKNLRAWFIAYGVGGPVLFLTNNEVASKISQSSIKAYIIWLFFIGVGLQIWISVLNKYVSWIIYAHDDETKQPLEWANRMSRRVWIDALVDVMTIVAFGAATLLTVNIFV